jgi:hypothetical protein
MNYELVKQLKEAGFPKQIKIYEVGDKRHPAHSFYYQPTLSELIEAVQPRFSTLEFHAPNVWTARALFDLEMATLPGIGSAPEEAVAKLWLALQGK